MNKLICPISDEKVNRVVVRLTGFFVSVITVLYALTLNPIILVFLIVDFIIRAFSVFKFSPLSLLSCGIVILLNINPDLIDKAPKLFAARVGLLFSLLGVMLYFVSPIASIITVLVLGLFATLESVFNFCVGCIIYTYIILPTQG